MADDLARAQRKELELLQGRVKEAKHDLALTQSEGFSEELEALASEATALEAELAQQKHALIGSQGRLLALRQEVEETERLALVPKTLRSVGPGVFAISFAGALASFWAMGDLLTTNPTWLHFAALGAATALPPVLLAWLLRRRFNGDGTFRNPS